MLLTRLLPTTCAGSVDPSCRSEWDQKSGDVVEVVVEVVHHCWICRCGGVLAESEVEVLVAARLEVKGGIAMSGAELKSTLQCHQVAETLIPLLHLPPNTTHFPQLREGLRKCSRWLALHFDDPSVVSVVGLVVHF